MLEKNLETFDIMNHQTEIFLLKCQKNIYYQ